MKLLQIQKCFLLNSFESRKKLNAKFKSDAITSFDILAVSLTLFGHSNTNATDQLLLNHYKIYPTELDSLSTY